MRPGGSAGTDVKRGGYSCRHRRSPSPGPPGSGPTRTASKRPLALPIWRQPKLISARAQAQLDLLRAGVRPEVRILAAEANLASTEAALQQTRSVLNDMELRAPFPGVVAEIAPAVGEQVGPGAKVVLLADFSTWQIETDDLTELDVVKVKEGSSTTIEFDALPDVQLTGTVVQIKPVGVNKQGDITYTVVIRPDEYDDRLRWNMTATVTIE